MSVDLGLTWIVGYEPDRNPSSIRERDRVPHRWVHQVKFFLIGHGVEVAHPRPHDVEVVAM